ncbi:hypothetical protein AAMO2058_001198900, partial [Amorphochlora amoebiformis]
VVIRQHETYKMPVPFDIGEEVEVPSLDLKGKVLGFEVNRRLVTVDLGEEGEVSLKPNKIAKIEAEKLKMEKKAADGNSDPNSKSTRLKRRIKNIKRVNEATSFDYAKLMEARRNATERGDVGSAPDITGELMKELKKIDSLPLEEEIVHSHDSTEQTSDQTTAMLSRLNISEYNQRTGLFDKLPEPLPEVHHIYHSSTSDTERRRKYRKNRKKTVPEPFTDPDDETNKSTRQRYEQGNEKVNKISFAEYTKDLNALENQGQSGGDMERIIQEVPTGANAQPFYAPWRGGRDPHKTPAQAVQELNEFLEENKASHLFQDSNRNFPSATVTISDSLDSDTRSRISGCSEGTRGSESNRRRRRRENEEWKRTHAHIARALAKEMYYNNSKQGISRI